MAVCGGITCATRKASSINERGTLPLGGRLHCSLIRSARSTFRRAAKRGLMPAIKYNLSLNKTFGFHVVLGGWFQCAPGPQTDFARTLALLQRGEICLDDVKQYSGMSSVKPVNDSRPGCNCTSARPENSARVSSKKPISGPRVGSSPAQSPTDPNTGKRRVGLK